MGYAGNDGNRRHDRGQMEKWTLVTGLAALGVGLFAIVVALSEGTSGGANQSGESRVADILYQFVNSDTFGIYLVVVTYLLIVLATRWLLLARPLRSSLRSQVRSMQAEVAIAEIDDKARGEVGALLAEAYELISRESPSTKDRLFWGTYEIETTALLRNAQLLMTSRLPDAELDALLVTLALERESNAGNDRYAKEIRAALKAESSATPERKRALATEVLALGDGADFSYLTTWHRKSFFLILSGLVFVLVFALTLSAWEILALGAVGAFVSRLWRALRTLPGRNVEPWAAWTTLMMAPIAGALAAGGGVLLISFLRDLEVLGEALDEVVWSRPGSTVPVHTLAAAFLLGFSERLLSGLAARGEGAVAPAEDDSVGKAPPPAGGGGAAPPAEDDSGGNPPPPAGAPESAPGGDDAGEEGLPENEPPGDGTDEEDGLASEQAAAASPARGDAGAPGVSASPEPPEVVRLRNVVAVTIKWVAARTDALARRFETSRPR